uniref:Dynein axonemal intermediate chain 4 n=1 Tax=Cyclopterus lumpus TaxID=8103 RepID=A0A8C2X2Y7_CYCLU
MYLSWPSFILQDSSIYVVGTWEGPIHKGCVSNNKHFLETYQQHSCPVNGIEWSPFNSYVFLSCSSDWTIQLWRKDLFIPVLSFTSTQRDVLGVKWSPNWSTVFAAHNGEQVEIWDMNASIIYPLIVHQAPAGVKVKSLLFTTGIDCVLVGDSDGQVTVYQIKNLSVGEDKKEVAYVIFYTSPIAEHLEHASTSRLHLFDLFVSSYRGGFAEHTSSFPQQVVPGRMSDNY